jgi:hypothetical protein
MTKIVVIEEKSGIHTYVDEDRGTFCGKDVLYFGRFLEGRFV